MYTDVLITEHGFLGDQHYFETTEPMPSLASKMGYTFLMRSWSEDNYVKDDRTERWIYIKK